MQGSALLEILNAEEDVLRRVPPVTEEPYQ